MGCRITVGGAVLATQPRADLLNVGLFAAVFSNSGHGWGEFSRRRSSSGALKAGTVGARSNPPNGVATLKFKETEFPSPVLVVPQTVHIFPPSQSMWTWSWGGMKNVDCLARRSEEAKMWIDCGSLKSRLANTDLAVKRDAKHYIDSGES